MGVEPSFSPLPLASGYASVLGAGAVTLALSQRETTGQGDRIEVPLASALMEGLAYNLQDIENYPERYKSNREREIDHRRTEGIVMDASYSELQELLDPFYLPSAPFLLSAVSVVVALLIFRQWWPAEASQ